MKDSGKPEYFPTLNNKAPWNFFEKRIRSAAELKRLIPVNDVEPEELQTALNNQAETEKRCIYIHIPFCNKSCTFLRLYYKCVNPEQETVEKFVNALKMQIEKNSLKKNG